MAIRRTIGIVLASIGLLFVGACGDDHDTHPHQDTGVQVALDATALPDAGNASGDSGTIEVEARLGGLEQPDVMNTFLEIGPSTDWYSRILLTTSGRYLRALHSDDTGLETGVGVRLSSFQPTRSHTVTFTWGSNAASWCIDGRLVGESTYPGTLRLPPGTPLRLRAHPQGSPNGTVGVVRLTIYGRPLNPDEIA